MIVSGFTLEISDKESTTSSVQKLNLSQHDDSGWPIITTAVNIDLYYHKTFSGDNTNIGFN